MGVELLMSIHTDVITDLMEHDYDAHVWETVNFWSDQGVDNWRLAMELYAS